MSKEVWIQALSQMILRFSRGKLRFPLVKVSSELLSWPVLYDFPFHTFVERVNRKLLKPKERKKQVEETISSGGKVRINYYL